MQINQYISVIQLKYALIISLVYLFQAISEDIIL
nr:MAG TPA: hypothetical protein [Caudoviricetes sp.]